MGVGEPVTLNIADLLNVSAFGLVVIIVLVGGRYLLGVLHGLIEFLQSTIKENAEVQKQNVIAMQALTLQIQNGRVESKHEHDDITASVIREHETTRKEMRGLGGRLGHWRIDDAPSS